MVSPVRIRVPPPEKRCIRRELEALSDDFRDIHGLPLGVRFEGDPHDGARLDRCDRGVDLVHEWREVLAGVALCSQQHDCEVEVGEVLLIRYAFVCAQQHVEALLGQAQELSVRLPGPTCFGDGYNLVPFALVSLQAAVHVLVQEHPHLGLPDKLYRRSAVAGEVVSAARRVVSR